MTKQEEIREGIAEITEDRFRASAEGAGLVWDRNFHSIMVNDILQFLHSQGVVIKGKYYFQSDLYAVEPLIKEEK